MSLLRRELGAVLRDHRRRQRRGLRSVAAAARVSVGYLSEVERGRKEASSELLAAICAGLDVPLSRVVRQASEALAAAEPATGEISGAGQPVSVLALPERAQPATAAAVDAVASPSVAA